MHDTSPAPLLDDKQGGIYLIAAHPHWRESRVNRSMFAAASALPGVATVDLYGRYPDYHIDVAAEQARLAAARLVVLMHPVQWYAAPPLQKLWFEEVLTWGWAYGRGDGSHGNALRGKDLWLAATTGGPQDVFLPPYAQTATQCGMRFATPLVLHGTHTAPEAAVAAHIDQFVQRLKTYPHWPEFNDMPNGVAAEVPPGDRPD